MSALELARRSAALEEIQSRSWIQHAEWFERIDSTSDFARRWLTANSQPRSVGEDPSLSQARFKSSIPALFVTDQQTAGRGRSSNQWWSPVGCLMMTLVVGSDSLPVDSSEWPKLSLVCGVAAAEAIEQIAADLRVQLKWPNDLYVSNRKLGGILIESIPPSEPGQSHAWLIGIGVNAQVSWQEAPTGLRDRATCLASECGRGFDRESLLVALVESLQFWIGQWNTKQADWRVQWSKRSLLNGRLVQVRIPPDVIFAGRCEDLNSQGHLLVRSERELRTIQAGEITGWSD